MKLQSHNQTPLTDRELYELDLQRTRESVERAKAVQDHQPTLRLKAIGCACPPFDFPIDTCPPSFVKHTTAKCPGCPPDSFPRLCKILRGEERS